MRGPNYRVPFQRRKKGKTDYKQRKALILSNLPRLVIRGTLKHMLVQVFKAKTTGDEVIVSAHSQELTKAYGWQGACSNVPAAYLTGLICGYRSVATNTETAVLDIGLQSPSRGARVFASLKGFLDAGATVPHSENMIPDESRIRGQHIADYANNLSNNPELYQQKFSRYLLRGIRPEQIPEHFTLIQEKIVSSFKEGQI